MFLVLLSLLNAQVHFYNNNDKNTTIKQKINISEVIYTYLGVNVTFNVVTHDWVVSLLAVPNTPSVGLITTTS